MVDNRGPFRVQIDHLPGKNGKLALDAARRDQYLHAAIVKHQRQAARRIGGIKRHIDRPGFHRAEQGDDQLDGTGQAQPDPFARLQRLARRK